MPNIVCPKTVEGTRSRGALAQPGGLFHGVSKILLQERLPDDGPPTAVDLPPESMITCSPGWVAGFNREEQFLGLRELEIKDWWRVALREIPNGLALGAMLGLVGIVRISVWQYLAFYDYGEHWMLIALTVAATLVGTAMSAR